MRMDCDRKALYKGLSDNQGPLQRPICSGTAVHISASAPPNANLFNVNLQCGPSVINPRDDVAFHLSINFNSFTIIMNSIFGNQWGLPENGTGQFPFKRGQDFFIDIVCDHSAFLVNVNGISTARFQHRVKPSRINHLAIDGDLILRDAEIRERPQCPGGFAALPSRLSPAGMPPTPPSTIIFYPSGNISEIHWLIRPVDGWFQYPTHSPAPYQQQIGPCPQQSKPYPQQPGTNPGHPRSYQQQPGTYPQTPGMYPQQTVPYPRQPILNPSAAPYPQLPGQAAPVSPVPSSSQIKKKATIDWVVLGSIGGVVEGAASSGLRAMKKGAKKLEKLANKVRDKLT